MIIYRMKIKNVLIVEIFDKGKWVNYIPRLHGKFKEYLP